MAEVDSQRKAASSHTTPEHACSRQHVETQHCPKGVITAEESVARCEARAQTWPCAPTDPSAPPHAGKQREHAAAPYLLQRKEEECRKERRKERERDMYTIKGCTSPKIVLTGNKPYLHINNPAHIPHLHRTYSAHKHPTNWHMLLPMARGTIESIPLAIQHS